MNKFLLAALTIFTAFASTAQGFESFNNMPANASNYTVRTWTGDNGRTWTADSARTDQTLNGRAIAIKSAPAKIVCNGIPNGVGNITFLYQQIFTTPGAVLELIINGNSYGTVAATTAKQTATFNNINVPGNFNLEIRNTSTTFNARVLIDSIAWTGYTGQPCVAPTAQPTNLTFGTATNNSISGSFTAASPASNEYLVVVSTSSTLSAVPQNGTVYSEGDLVGNGTVLSNTNATAFNATTLSPGTTYYFYVFAVNSACTGGPLYNTTNALTGSSTTATPPVCSAPTATPGPLALTAAGTSISGSFTDAAGADGYMVIISNNPTLGFTPANGTTYSVNQTAGNGTVIKYGSGTSFSATGLTISTTYYFYVFAVSNFNCTGGPFYNTTSSNGTAMTTANATGEPTGYYSTTTGLSCETLKDTLSRIITRGFVSQSYNSLWDHFQSTDKRLNDAGNKVIVWDMYSDNPTGPEPYEYTFGAPFQDNGSGGGAEGQKYNREHSWPNSWFGGSTSNPAYSDLFHLYPTDKFVNNLRSSFPFGETAGPTPTLNGGKLGESSFAGVLGTVFEPIDAYKGDFARTYFYMATRYHSQIAGWENLSRYGDSVMDGTAFPSFEIGYLRLLLKWHNQDPVSQKEIDRNQAVFAIQRNRNPFIDHPEYVQMVWNSSCVSGLAVLPVDIVSFSGRLVGGNVKLEWKVENEIRFNRYEIERSSNGSFYKTIGQVKAANLQNYSFDDDAESLKGQRVYYRLKAIDQDGNYKYSQVFTVHIPTNTRFTVYPNPAKSFIQLQLNKAIVGKATVQVTDLSGKVLKQQSFNANGNVLSVSTDNLSAGTYLVKLIYNNEQYLQKVMIAK